MTDVPGSVPMDEELREMVKRSGIDYLHPGWYTQDEADSLREFAALVAASERKRILNLLETLGMWDAVCEINDTLDIGWRRV